MKKFYLRLLTVSLLTTSVFSSYTPLVSHDNPNAAKALLTMVKNAVQSAGNRVSSLVNAAVSTAKTQSDKVVAAAKLQKDVLVVKAQTQKEFIAQGMKNVVADATAKAQVYGSFMYHKPEIAAEIVKQFVLKHKKEVGITVAAGLALYTLLRNVGPLAPSYSKKTKNKPLVITDGIIKSALKKSSAAALTAVLSIVYLNHAVTLKA